MKRSPFVTLIVLIFLSTQCYSQKQYNVWCFGTGAMLDFNNTPATGTGLCAMDQTEGCASICNAGGQLLFYTDGVKVWGRNDTQMPNGFGLFGGFSSSQSALIIPLPGSSNIYYVFTAPMQSQPHPVCYSIVDMNLNAAMGDVTIKNVPLSSASLTMTEKLTATPKSDGSGYWVLSQADNGRFDVYSFTAAGVNPTPVVSQTGLPSVSARIGYARISPDGSTLVVSHAFYLYAVDVFDFDNNTGIVTNAFTIPFTTGDRPYGMEFSSDNSKLYVQTYQGGIITQFNMLAGSPVDIQNSAIVVNMNAPLESGGALMRGPDNRIYVSRINRNYLGVIDQPHLLGIACNYIPQAIHLDGNCQFGLPNNINYPGCPAALAVANSVTICSNNSYQLPSGTIVSTPGTYNDTIRTVSGSCDSIITTVYLSVFPVTNINESAQICANQTYQLPSGTIVNTAGAYQDTIRSVGLCDSIITHVDLLVNDLSYSGFIDSVYEGDPYLLPSGQTVYAPGIYQVVLTNQLGCDSVITITLKQQNKDPECLTLKNAFTPNADGVNDYWVLYRNPCFKKLELNVYNRYGSLVYHADNYKNDWNGTYRNKSVPDGTYYYTINLFSFDSHTYFYKGDVTVIR